MKRRHLCRGLRRNSRALTQRSKTQSRKSGKRRTGGEKDRRIIQPAELRLDLRFNQFKQTYRAKINEEYRSGGVRRRDETDGTVALLFAGGLIAGRIRIVGMTATAAGCDFLFGIVAGHGDHAAGVRRDDGVEPHQNIEREDAANEFQGSTP